MSLLDNIKRTDVRYDNIITDCPYEINDAIEIDELLKKSPYRVNLLFCETFSEDELISLCERSSSKLINGLSYIPEISELSNISIVWDRSYDSMENGSHSRIKIYKLMFGMNFYRMSPYSAIWTFASVIDMMKMTGMCFNNTKINILGYKDGRIVDRLEYGDYIETYNLGMNYGDYTQMHTDRGDVRFRLSMKMHELNRDLFEYVIGRPIGKDEWNRCVNRSYEKYKRIRSKNK